MKFHNTGQENETVLKKLVIIAALEREITPLVRGWDASTVSSQDRDLRVFQQGDAVVVCGGIGSMSARAACDWAYKEAKGEVGLFISTGLVGALNPEFKVGDLFQPACIIDEADDLSLLTNKGHGVLVSAGAISGQKLKKILAEKHHADAVDMEAYAVADVARIYNVSFIAIKAVSDEFDFPMPPLGRFVSETGEFKTAGFAIYAAMRPWLWSTVFQLGKNSTKATQALCKELEKTIAQYSACEYNIVTAK